MDEQQRTPFKYLSELDYYMRTVKRILSALTQELQRMERDANTAEESENILDSWDFAFDDMESVFGIAFVTTQTYISTCVRDVNRIAEARKILPYKKDQLLHDFSDKLSNLSVTQLELCDAAANYFKHHDEWNGKSITNRNRRTIELLQFAGVIDDGWPCTKAASLLLKPKILDLRPLAGILVNWRLRIIEVVKGS